MNVNMEVFCRIRKELSWLRSRENLLKNGFSQIGEGALKEGKIRRSNLKEFVCLRIIEKK